jgi:crossover junction endodeoxyribonuclease RuvC
MKILGVDPGTATVGWAVLEEENDQIKKVGFGHIKTSPKKTDSDRLLEISLDLKEIIAKFKPQEAAVESLFFFKNKKTVMEVSQSRGVILLTLAQKRIKVCSYTPLQIKQSLTGYGKASKSQVQYMAKEILKLKEFPRPDDTADAIAVAICHLNSYKVLNQINSNQ